ncbi:MAG: M43 family zinc metalloprotease [Bacteroidota bacterium]
MKTSFSQPIRCATNEAESWNQQHYPNWPNREVQERWMQEQMIHHSIRDDGVLTIPVIVHIVHDGEPIGFGTNISAEQVQSQIDVLNEDYRRLIGTPGHNTHPNGADIELEFCLAAVNPQGLILEEPGIHRINRNDKNWGEPPYSIGEVKQQMMVQEFWDPEQYMNVWTAELSNDFLGFAQLPNFSSLPDLSPNHGPAATDGVVIAPTAFGRIGSARAPYNRGRTTTHEVGHWLGLWHIWGDGNCDVDDYCDDTPLTDEPNYGCPDPESPCGVLEMVNNYMDYSDDTCMNMFTVCQKGRMRTAMIHASRRFSLSESKACTGEAPPIAQFVSNRQFVCEGSTVRFEANEGNIPSSFSWRFPGGNPATSTLSRPVISYDKTGMYSVELIARNDFGTDTLFREAYIEVDTTGSKTIFFENFEEGLSRWEIENPDNRITWDLELIDGVDSGQVAIGINLYDYTISGERDGLISPVLDLSGYKGAVLSFGHAYRQTSIGDRDSLIIYASRDGGQTYRDRIFEAREDGSQIFATNSALNERFVPDNRSDWCQEGSAWADCATINLAGLIGTSETRLKFETYNGFGNDIYIDDITIEGSCIPIWEEPEDTVGHDFLFTLLPNPNDGNFKVRVFMDRTQDIEIYLFDIRGRQLQHNIYQGIPDVFEVNVETNNLPNAVYLVKIQIGQSVRHTKMIISH